ncbi:hypothetical protein BBJ28_00004977 [Nothophytophthora sp. Chile5]|nr:hypothetical protein BBJ28_00004977 [Nothophytophthora sp. Chile5]
MTASTLASAHVEPRALEDKRSVGDISEAKATRRHLKPRELLQLVQHAKLWSYRWLGWAFVYVTLLLYFFIYRSVGLSALIKMYGTEDDMTFGVQASVLSLGMLEDFVCATYLATALWVVDYLLSLAFGPVSVDMESMTVNVFVKWKRQRVIRRVVTFVMSWLLFLATAFPFIADILLVRLRTMRFTFELIAMAYAEREMASSVAIANYEYNAAFVTGAILVLVATFLAAVRTWTSWADLTRWNPTHLLLRVVRLPYHRKEQELGTPKQDSHRDEYDSDDKEDVNEALLESGKFTKYAQTFTPKRSSLSAVNTIALADARPASISGSTSRSTKCQHPMLYLRRVGWPRRGLQLAVLLLALVVTPTIVLAISQACSALVANVALDTTLNELFTQGLHVTKDGFVPMGANGNVKWASAYIHSATENYTLFGNASLYRRTHGFQGDLAFNVTVDSENPPNVLIIAVESFRFQDSRYLVGDEDPSNLLKGWNGTVVPAFDKWARRGVAFPNLWSSWKTSRSVASLLYGQIPLDSTQETDMTGGRKNVELAGMPQLFKAKGYESFFSTGCRLNYDGWDSFFEPHGFDTVWGEDDMRKIAEKTQNITSDDWKGSEHRAMNWGVHDDVSFKVLGDLLIQKTQEQRERVEAGQPKKPLFLAHYTISSHVDYKQRPKWFRDQPQPDFTTLTNGEKYADVVKDYLEIRRFTDTQLGEFMDLMEDHGVLNDTIVLIVGDHGQAPEFGVSTPEQRDLSVTRVAGALIAEGRLGSAVGLKIEDAVEQYDMLNTLADITGVPEEGFLQDGVGRSLKRNVTFGERIVFSNNPNTKDSIVRGHDRLRYDRSASSVLLHDAYTDHDMKNDLYPELTSQEQKSWLALRDSGREITAYYKRRWDKGCLLAAEC